MDNQHVLVSAGGPSCVIQGHDAAHDLSAALLKSDGHWLPWSDLQYTGYILNLGERAVNKRMHQQIDN